MKITSFCYFFIYYILDIINSVEMITKSDGEVLSNYLKKKELVISQPGGIHLTRSVIHRVLEERSKQNPTESLEKIEKNKLQEGWY